jgi:hypothetical protein
MLLLLRPFPADRAAPWHDARGPYLQGHAHTGVVTARDVPSGPRT